MLGKEQCRYPPSCGDRRRAPIRSGGCRTFEENDKLLDEQFVGYACSVAHEVFDQLMKLRTVCRHARDDLRIALSSLAQRAKEQAAPCAFGDNPIGKCGKELVDCRDIERVQEASSTGVEYSGDER